jgi:hypothetical protein
MMRKFLLAGALLLSCQLFGQITLVKTIDLEYPVARIVHFPKCGDSPLFLCKKSENTYVVVNDGINFEITNNENLLFADHYHLYTSHYTEGDIVLRKYEESGTTYKIIKEITLPRKVGDKHYYLDIEMTEDHLFYFAYQPNTVSKPHDATVEFYNSDLEKVFTVKEDLSVYNIHCFGMDSVLILKEYVYDKTLTTHLYNHTGKMLKEESFHLAFKPSTQSTVSDFLKDDGIIFTLEQTDTPKTHVIKFDHSGKMLWDEVLPHHYYGFSEFDEHLITYGGGDFKNPDYKVLFIDEHKGKIDNQVALKTHFLDFMKQKNLNPEENSFIPFGFNVNPEHTWISFIMSIYTLNGKNVEADRILIFHGHQKVQTLDIQLTGTEHPKVVPTDKNHLVVGIGKKVFIYKVQ